MIMIMILTLTDLHDHDHDPNSNWSTNLASDMYKMAANYIIVCWLKAAISEL